MKTETLLDALNRLSQYEKDLPNDELRHSFSSDINKTRAMIGHESQLAPVQEKPKRIGKFYMHLEAISDAMFFHAISRKMQLSNVFRDLHSMADGKIVVTAECPEFDEVPHGEQIPFYRVDFHLGTVGDYIHPDPENPYAGMEVKITKPGNGEFLACQ